MAQVVEHLLNKCRTLNSNPNTAKEKEKRREGGRRDRRKEKEVNIPSTFKVPSPSSVPIPPSTLLPKGIPSWRSIIT
jgi:hypothetical protein